MMREQFEKLPEIAERIKALQFNDYTGEYESSLMRCSNEAYVNGAWYAFQEQEKKIDEANKMNQKMMNRVIELSAELEKLENRMRRME